MDLWMPVAKVHELYTAACGLYICWLTLRATAIISHWAPLGWSNLIAKLNEWCLMVSLKIHSDNGCSDWSYMCALGRYTSPKLLYASMLYIRTIMS